MMFRFSTLLLLISISSFSFGQQPDKPLRKKLMDVIQPFRGNVALYVKNLKTGKTVDINADSIRSTASMVKIPILVGIMDKINRGELQFHQQITYDDSLLYPGVDILGS